MPALPVTLIMSNEDFDRTAREVFNTFVRNHPTIATFLGIHDYDHLMGENSRKFVEEEVKFAREFKGKFEAFEADELSGSRPLDRDLAIHIADLWLYNLEELRFWESDPGGAEGIGEGLFPLFTRDFAPLTTRVQSMTGRLEDAPGFLEEIKTRLSRPVKLWTEMAIESAGMTPAFLELIVHSVEGEVPDAAFQDLRKAKEEAASALSEYQTWLQEDVLPGASAPHIVGEEKFKRLVELRQLGFTVDEIRDMGVRYLEESKEELSRLTESIDPKATVEEMNDRIKGKHPDDFEAVLENVRQTIMEARKFVAEEGLATLPPAEKLHVIETPTFIRPIIPFAALFGPAKFDKVQEGVYIVTPPSDGVGDLRKHSYASIRNTAVHEGYPGHHLQLSAANLNPSIVRIFGSFGATETVEGWAHYCEDMMQETGFSASPEVRFVQLQDIIWRACRIIIDVDLHSGRMTFDEAVDMLVREAGIEKPAALAEVKRYTQNPGYQLSYLLGKHLIQGLRDEVQKGMGENFSLGFFHDTILYAGSIPFFLLKKAVGDKLAKLDEDVQDLS